MAEDQLNGLDNKKDIKPYGMVIIDINNFDLTTGISPDEKFYSSDFLKQLKVIQRIFQTRSGDNDLIVAINMIFRGNEEKRLATVEEFKEIFEVVFSMKSDKEANEVFVMISTKNVIPEKYNKVNITTQIHALQKYLGVDWTKGMNTIEHIDNMVLHKPKEAESKKPKDKKKKKKHKK